MKQSEATFDPLKLKSVLSLRAPHQYLLGIKFSKYGTPNVVTTSGITLDNLYNCCSLNSVVSKLDSSCKVWDELVKIKKTQL